MPARIFRPFHVHGLGAMFAPRKPRHPLLRLAAGLVGLVLLAVLLVVGVLVGTLMLVAGLLRRPSRRAAAGAADPRVVDGEYRVVRKPALPLAR